MGRLRHALNEDAGVESAYQRTKARCSFLQRMVETNFSTSGPMLNDIVEHCVFDVKYMADLFDNHNQKLGSVVALLPETIQRQVTIMAPEDIKHAWEYKILEGSRRRANKVQDPDYERGGRQSMSRCPGDFPSFTCTPSIADTGCSPDPILVIDHSTVILCTYEVMPRPAFFARILRH